MMNTLTRVSRCTQVVLLGLVFCYCLGGPIQGVTAAPSFEEASSAAIDVSTLLTCTETDALCGPIPVNCSYGDRGEQWVEFTQELNYTQYYGTTEQAATLPDPLPLPYVLSATDYSAPGNNGTCDSRSPMTPANCTENCVYNVIIPELSPTERWTIIAELKCSGTYPRSSSSGSTSLSDAKAEPGTVIAIMTEQCKDYNYIPPWFASVSDGFGGKWALQTAQNDTQSDEEWAQNLNSVVFPSDFSPWENVTITTNQTHPPYLVGDTCYSFIMRDSNDNAWHMYEYPEDITQGLLSNIDCVPFVATTLGAIQNETSSGSNTTQASSAAGKSLTGVLTALFISTCAVAFA